METQSNVTEMKKYPEPDRSLPIQTRDTYLLIATFASVMIAMGILMAFMHRNCRKSLSRVNKWFLHLWHSNPTYPRNESSRVIMSLGINDPTSPIFSKEINPPTSVIDIRGSYSNLSGYNKSNPISEEDSGISVISDVPTIVHYSLIKKYSEKIKSKSFDKSLRLSVSSDLNYNQEHYPEESHYGPNPGYSTFPVDGHCYSEDKDNKWITPVRVQLLHGRNTSSRNKNDRIKHWEFRDSMDITENENDNEFDETTGHTQKYRNTNDNFPQSDSCLQDIYSSGKGRRRRNQDRKTRRSGSYEDMDFTLINTADWINSNDIYKRNLCYSNSCYVSDSTSSFIDVFNENVNPPCVSNSETRPTNSHPTHQNDRPLHRNKTMRRHNAQRRDKESIKCTLEKQENSNSNDTNVNNCVSIQPSLTFEEITKRKSLGRKLPKLPRAK